MMARALLTILALLTGLAAGTATTGGTAKAAEAAACPRLSGSFFQPLAHHEAWRPADWDGLFEELALAGVDSLFVQWTRLDRFRVFAEPGEDERALPGSLLDRLLAAAEAQGVSVWLGLVHDPDFWSRAEREPEQVEVYLERHRLAVGELARRLLEEVGDHPAFVGWYISEEVDDVAWWDPAKRPLFRAHIGELVPDLHALDGGRPVALSGFTSGRLDPAAYATLWAELVEASGLDLVLFQDSGGVGTLPPADSGVYQAILGPRVREAGAEFGVVVELFTQTAGPPLDDADFAAEPGSIERIAEQIAVAGRHADRLVGFSLPAYMSSAGGPAAAALYRRYLSRVVEGDCP